MQSTPSKPALRDALRERRRAIPVEQRAQASNSIAGHATGLPCWRAAKHIALYLPADGEIETTALTQRARDNGADLYLPVVSEGGVMHFALWEPGASLEVNRYGIGEPAAHCPLRAAGALDIIFLPLVGWSEDGARLGMGGGFYDRALSGAEAPLLVGLGYECQKVSAIPVENWDIPLDFVVTEKALHNCGAGD